MVGDRRATTSTSLLPCGDTQQVVAADACSPPLADVETVVGQLVQEFTGGEPILARMVKQHLVGRPSKGGRGDLVKEEPPTRFEYAGHLVQGFPPVRDVVNDREVEVRRRRERHR